MPYNVFSYCQMKQLITAVMLHYESDDILMSFHQSSSGVILTKKRKKRKRTGQVFLHNKTQRLSDRNYDYTMVAM